MTPALGRDTGAVLAVALLVASLATPPPSADLARLNLHELVAILPRCGEPEWVQGPRRGDGDFVPALAELRRRIDVGMPLDLECWRRILIDKGYLHWRRKWPTSSSFEFRVDLPGLQDAYELEVRTDLPGAEPARFFHRCACACAMSSPQEVRGGYLSADQREVQLELRPYYQSLSNARSATARVLAVGSISIPVEPVAAIEEAIQPIDDALYGLRLRAALRVDLVQRVPRLSISDLDWPPWLAASLDIELLHEGRVETARQLFDVHRQHASTGLDGLSPPARESLDGRVGWALRIRGTSKRVLGDTGASGYWAGELEIPLVELFRRE